MMPPDPKITSLARLSRLALVLAVGLIGWLGWESFESSARALQARGWARAVHAPARDPGQFAARCLVDGACGKAFTTVWGNRFPSWALGLPLLGIAGLIAGRVLTRVNRKDPGEARWATRQDMKPYLGEKSGRVGYLGLLEGKHVVRLPENARCAHTLVIGGTGAGKTTRYVNPNLLLDARDGVSAVVFDLKYPDPKSGFLDTINYFKAWGRGVYPFTPFDPDSVRMPLIGDVKTVQEALSVAEAFRPSGGKEEESGAFYRNSERQLLAGLILGIAQGPNPSMKQVFDLLGGGADSLKAFAKERPYLKSLLGTILELRADMLTGIATGLMGDLLPFTNPNLDRATSSGQGQLLDLESLCSTPGFLYIGLPQEEIQGGQGQVLLRLIKRVLDKAILSVAGKNGGRLPVHLSIYLDEFPSFGPIPNIAENLATMRSRRVAYHIAMQNLAQGQAVYGKEEFAGMINNNFAQMVVFPRSLRLEDATFFSEIFGEMTVLEESFSRTRTSGPLFMNPLAEVKKMQGGKVAKRALLSAEAMRTFPDGNAVIETIGSPPAMVRMPRLDERDNPYRKLYTRITSSYKTPQLRKPGVSAASAPVLELTPATPPEAARNPLAENFRAWFEALLGTGVALQADVDDGKPVSVTVQRSDLPDLPAEATEWVGKGWLELGERTVVVPRLGLTRVTKFHKAITARAARGGSVEAGRAVATSGPPPPSSALSKAPASVQPSKSAPPRRESRLESVGGLKPASLEPPSTGSELTEPCVQPVQPTASSLEPLVSLNPPSLSRPPRLGAKPIATGSQPELVPDSSATDRRPPRLGVKPAQNPADS